MAYIPFRLGTRTTSAFIKGLGFLMIVCSILSIIPPATLGFSFSSLFQLSVTGIKNGNLWQFLTALFILPSKELSLRFLLHLAFNLYLVISLGDSLLKTIGRKSFFTLCLGSGLVATSIAFFELVKFFPQQTYGANIPLVLAIAIAWTMAHPDAKIPGFYKAKWIILLIVAIHLSLDLLHHNYLSLSANLAAVLFSCLFSLFTLKSHGPFVFLGRMEKKLLFHMRKKDPSFEENKKNSANISSDEEFIDIMLEKISLKGHESLSEEEKKRMEEISKGKQKRFGGKPF